MTDRFNSLTVVLEKNVRDDDAEALIAAIMQFKGVIAVEGNVASFDSIVADQRARHELAGKVMDVIYPPKED